MSLSLFNIEGEHPRSAKAIGRRFVLWSIVCWISGAPSFFLAGGIASGTAQFHRGAMALGILLFSTLYTIATSTDAFDRFHRIPGVRRTLYIGYFTRMGMSIIFPVAVAADMLPGVISVATGAAFAEDNRFLATFIATCIQGVILNLVISVYMLIVYFFVRRYGAKVEPRGFEVIPVALVLSESPERE